MPWGAGGYFLLTGTNLFQGATLMDLLNHHLNTAPTPPSERLGRPVPPALEALILACLAKDPANRPACATAMAQALDGCAGESVWCDADARDWWSSRRRTRPVPACASRYADVSEAITVVMAGRGIADQPTAYDE